MQHFLSVLSQYPIIPIFLFVNLLVSFWAHKQRKSHSFLDYAVASRDLPTAVLVMTLLGTYLSADTFGNIELYMAYGIAHIVPLATIVLSFFLIGTFIAPKLVYFESTTAGGIMGSLYGRLAQFFTGGIGFLFCLLVISGQISILGKIASIVLEVDFRIAILFFCGLVVLYSTWGGLRSVSYTDVIQLIALLFLFGFVTFSVLAKIGGVSVLLEKIQSGELDQKLRILTYPGLAFRVKVAIMWGLPFSLMLTPPIVHRMLVTQDKREVKKMWYTGAFILTAVIISPLFIAFSLLVGRDSIGLSAEKNILACLVKVLFSGQPILFSVMFIGMISVALSTIDSYLHTAGIILVEDLIEPIRLYLGKYAIKQKKKVFYAKVGIALLGICAIILGIQFEDSVTGITRRVLAPALTIYISVNIPLLLGILGLKTDRYSLVAFLCTFFGTFSILNFIGWREDLLNSAHILAHYFVLAAALALVAYFCTHLYINGGIVTLHRGPHTTGEKLWKPSRKGMMEWLRTTFNLVSRARDQVVHERPMQSLSFSLLIFALYMVRSIVSASAHIRPEFLAAIHFTGIVLCSFLMLGALWPHVLKPYLPLYWFVTLFYCLPLSSTLMFLHHNEGMASYTFFIASFVLLSYLVSSSTFVWMSLCALFLAHLGWYVVAGSLPEGLSANMNYMLGLFVVMILIVSVLTLVRGSEQHTKDRLYMQKAFASAIPHEVRKPLSAISFVGFASDKISKTITPIKNKEGESGFFVSEKMQKVMAEHGQKIIGSLDEVKNEFSRFTKLLDRDISSEPQEVVRMKPLIESLLPTLSKRYTEEVNLSITCKKDFKARIIKPLFGNVLANLLKNAKRHGGASKVQIRIDGVEHKVYVRDNGHGIAKKSLPYIFKLGFSGGGKTNHGVGLALVQFILMASGVKISCHSRQGDKDSFTEFVISFPLM